MHQGIQKYMAVFSHKSVLAVLYLLLSTTLAVSMDDALGLELDGNDARELQVLSYGQKFLPPLRISSIAYLPQSPLLDDELFCPEENISQESEAVRHDTHSADGENVAATGPFIWPNNPGLAAQLVMRQLENRGRQEGLIVEGAAGPVVNASKQVKSKKQTAGQQAKGEFVCEYPDCGGVFTQWVHLSRHESAVHRGEKPHACTHEGCGRVFGQKSNLTRHQIVHTRERNFPCTYPGCGKTYSAEGHLRRHIKAHEAALQAASESSLVSSSSSSSKKRKPGKGNAEVQSITNNKKSKSVQPQSADKQEKGAEASQTPATKKRTNKRKFLCDHPGCGQAVTSLRNLTKHQAAHEKSLAYTCLGCGKRCGSQNALEAHINKHKQDLIYLKSIGAKLLIDPDNV